MHDNELPDDAYAALGGRPTRPRPPRPGHGPQGSGTPVLPFRARTRRERRAALERRTAERAATAEPPAPCEVCGAAFRFDSLGRLVITHDRAPHGGVLYGKAAA